MGRSRNDQSFRRLTREDGSHYGVSEDGSIVEYSDDDVAILTADLDELGKRITTALGLEVAATVPSPARDAVYVGSFVHRGNRSPVFLLIPADDEAFHASMALLSTTSPAVVLLPSTRRIPGTLHARLSAFPVATFSLSDCLAVCDGIFVPSLRAEVVLSEALRRVLGQADNADGVRGTSCIIYKGVEYSVELTKREAAFLSEALKSDEVPLDQMLHPKHGLIAKMRFTNSPNNRNLVSRFLTALNRKLSLESNPRIPFSYSLPPRGDSVVRDDHQ